MAQASTLRLQFPVSSGSQHHAKESEWVPVEKPSGAPASAASAPVPPPVATGSPAAAAASAPAAPAPVEKVPEEQKVFPELSNVVCAFPYLPDRLFVGHVCTDS